MRNKFDLQLDRMKSDVDRMGELYDKAIANATEKAVEAKDLEMAKMVVGEARDRSAGKRLSKRLCLKLLLTAATGS